MKPSQPYQQPPHDQGYYNQGAPLQHTNSYGSPPPSGPGAYADRGYDSRQGQGPPGSEAELGGDGKERGIGATIVGASGGGFLGHELGGGVLGTIGGMIAGAVGANALEHRHEKLVPQSDLLKITLG